MKKMSYSRWGIAFLISIAFLSAPASFGVGSTAKSVQKVLAALKIETMSDLDFGAAPQGDPEKTVAPGVADNSENASFLVSGEPGKVFTIQLPAEIYMQQRGGRNRIRVNRFRSNPDLLSTLDPAGRRQILVGATREALPATLPRGDYEGVFQVDVVYQ